MGKEDRRYFFRYKIYTFSMKKLLQYGMAEGDTLVIDDKNVCRCFKDLSRTYEVKSDSILFYQARLIVNRNVMDNVYSKYRMDSDALLQYFITVDFTDALYDFKRISKYRFIKFRIPGAKDSCRFTYFMKSNSMSKDNMILYINADKKFEINNQPVWFIDEMEKRLNLGLNKGVNKIHLSKWYAYSGLALSDVKLVDELLITEDNALVIKDFEKVVYTKCITAVSLQSLDKDVEAVFKPSKEAWRRKVKFDKLRSYAKSKDWKMLEFAEKYRPGAKDVFEAIKLIARFIDNAEAEGREYLLDKDKEDWLGSTFVKKIRNNARQDVKIAWFELESNEKYPFPHELNAFDGEGLISEEMADKINGKLRAAGLTKEDHYSFQIRLPFIKGVLHACDMHAFFKNPNHRVETIKGIRIFDDRNKQFEEYPADKIDFIFTESQVKMSKLAANIAPGRDDVNLFKEYIKLLRLYDHKLGITSFEPKVNKHARLNLEFMATLPLNKDDYDYIINGAKSELYKSLTEEELTKDLDGADAEIYGANKEFFKSTNRYQDLFDIRFSSTIKDSLEMELDIVKSRRMFLSSDLMMLLNHASGLMDNTRNKKANGSLHRLKDGELMKHQCYLSNSYSGDVFSPGKQVMLLRNPHYARNEIAILQCADDNGLRSRYFSKIKGVVWINPYSLIAERLGGADYDGDEVEVIGDEYLVDKVFRSIKQKEYNLSKYPAILIPSLKDDRDPDENNLKNSMKCFQRTFSSDVGRISNEALRVAEYAYNSPIPEEDNVQIARIVRSNFVAFYTILGGISIDAAKKGYKPDFVPATSFMMTTKDDIRENYASSRYIEFKDTVDKIKYFDKPARDFTNGNELSDNTALGKKYRKLMKTESDDTFWAKYIVNAIRDWKRPELDKGEERVVADSDCYHNSLVFLKAAATRKIVFSYLKNEQDLNDDRTSNQAVINSVMRNSCLPGENDAEIVDTMIDSIMKCSIIGEKLLEKYCNSTCQYHFLQKDSDKEIFIRDTLGLDRKELPPEICKYFKRFDNGGFKNLYLAILYKAIDERYDPDFMFRQFPESMEEFDKWWNWLYKGGIRGTVQFKNYIADISEEINTRANGLINDYLNGKHCSIKAFKEQVNQALANDIRYEAGNITLEQAQYVMNVMNDTTAFDLCHDAYIRYLKEPR